MTTTRNVLVVPEHGSEGVADRLASAADGLRTTAVASVAEARDRLGGGSVDCLVIGLDPPGGSWEPLLDAAAAQDPPVPTVVATANGSEQAACDVVAAGAERYVPLDSTDVTELARQVRAVTEERRRDIESREQYETIVETVPDGVFVLDEESTVVRINETGAEMLGFDGVADAVGTPIPSLVTEGTFSEAVIEEYLDIVPELLSDASDRRMGRFEFAAWPDGERRVYQASVALRPFDEEYRGTIGILRDITERRRRQEELEQYETIVEAIPDAVWAMNADGEYTFVNESMYELSGHEPGAADGTGARIGMTEDGIERARGIVSRLLSDDDPLGPSATFEHELIRRDGEVLDCETHLALLPFETDFRGTAGITRDITDRKQRVRRLEILSRVLRHNLRNDLTTVIELADLIEHEYDDPALHRYAGRISDIAFALVDASDEIRKVQEAIDTDTADPDTVALAPLVRDVVAEFREAYPAATIDVDAADVEVRGNESLRLALANLIENAIEHNDGATPTVEISMLPAADPPRQVASDSIDPADWMELRVADDGPGIPEHERAVVTGDAEVTQLNHSSGIGLWLVDWIVTAFGGSLHIEDRVTDAGETDGTIVVLSLRRTE